MEPLQTLLVLQHNRRRRLKDSSCILNHRLDNNSSCCKYDAAVDNEFCDIIIALYKHEYNTVIDDSNIENISIDNMIDAVYDNDNISDNNGKTDNDLQIQLAMLWRIITIIKKSKTIIILILHI